MGETKTARKEAKKDLDRKLALSTPSRSLLEELAITVSKTPSPDATFQVRPQSLPLKMVLIDIGSATGLVSAS
jgi:hypothetical protein